MNQLAKLFVRGKLVNVTAKNLTEDQKKQVEDLMFQVWQDPELDSAKTEFCSILQRTIGNEYKDRDFAMAEIWVTFWRTAVNVLFHVPKDVEAYQKWADRRNKILTNPVVRKKYFKTYLYMYMRQILNENKIQTRSVKKTISGPANVVGKELLEFYLQNSVPRKINYTLDEQKGITTIYCNTNLIPMKTLKKICQIKDELSTKGANIEINDDAIKISSNQEQLELITKKVSEKERAKFNSLNGFNNDDETKDSFQQHCEYQAISKMGNDMDYILMEDQVSELNNRLNSQNQKILEILINPPQEFLDKFYPNRKKIVRPKETHIARWLGLPKDQVSKSVKLIQKQATALDIK